MKILIDARFFGTENTGIGRYVENLIKSLVKVDHDNTYYILVKSKYYATLKYPNNFYLVKSDIPHYSFSEQISLPMIIQKYQPDVIHFPHFNVPLLCRSKYIVTIHDLLMHQYKGKETTTLPYFVYQIKRLGYKFVFNHAVYGASRVIVPSDSVKSELLSYYKIHPKKVVRTYEGVETLTKSKNAASILKKYNLKPLKYFVYAGNAYPHKNLERIVGAFVQLNSTLSRNQHSKREIAIISARGVFTKRLVNLVAKYNARGYIKLLGYIPDSELSALYLNALAFVSASFTEGFGLPVLEAMASGTLGIVSNIPVYKEVYKDSVLYFDPYNIDSISEGLNKILQMTNKERTSRVKAGQAFVRRYSWEKMAVETVKIYESVGKTN